MKQCRICLEENENISDLISPCQCNGTQKYVHSKCLEKWRKESVNTIKYERCQECLTDYQVQVIGENSKCFSFNKNNIRGLYFIILKTGPIAVILNYLFFYLVGYLFIQTFNFFNLNLDYYFRNMIFKDHFLFNPIIGSCGICIFNVIFYHMLMCYISCNKKDITWKTTNGVDITRLNKMHLCNFVVIILLPFIGLIMQGLTLKITSIFFFEYFFSKYLTDQTKVIGIGNEDRMPLIV